MDDELFNRQELCLLCIIDYAFAIKVLQAGRVSPPYQDPAGSELSMSANSIVALCSDKLILALALLGIKVLQCRAIDMVIRLSKYVRILPSRRSDLNERHWVVLLLLI